MLLMVITIVMSALLGCATSEDIPIPEVKEDTYVYDVDNIIDDETEKKLNELLVELEEKTDIEFAVISVESLLNRSIEYYANTIFNTLEIGKKEKDNGILLLFSRSDKKVRLEIGRGLEGDLNDSKCGRILDEYFVPYRENDEYTEATEMTVEAVISVIAEEYEINIQDLDKKQLSKDEYNYGWIYLIIIVIAIIIIVKSGGHSSGGYYGGSSDGFSSGGFGGGFSGGGGASR